jgi:predicted dehydrogenase
VSPAGRGFDLAVVGTGGIAGYHAEAAARLGGRVRITAAVDPDPQRLAAFCDKWSVPRRFPDLPALLAAERPDLVVLASPPHRHAGQAVECLHRGLTVWCEKPPAVSLAELDRIAAVEAAGAGRFAAVFQHRFGSGVRNLQALHRAGELGEPMTAVCHTLWFRDDDYFTGLSWRGDWRTEGGGPTLGHGIHQLDLLLAVLGEWREVVAVAARRARPTRTEDLSAAIITFRSGAVATVVNSLLSPREVSYLRFDYRYATVELEHRYGYGDGDWRVTPAPGHAQRVAAAWRAGPNGQASGHAAQLAAVLDALGAGTPPPLPLDQVRSTMELVAATYAAAFTGSPVARGQIGPGTPFYHRMDGSGAPWESRW